jgi:hypothetical protein
MAGMLRRIQSFISTACRILLPVAMMTFGIAPVSVEAVSPPSPTDSHYEDTMTGTASTDYITLYNLGCHAAGTGQSGVVVLDFAEQTTSGGVNGTRNWDGNFTSDRDIETAVAGYAKGWHDCGTQSVDIAIGTNNDVSVSSSLGSDWAGVANAVFTWVEDHNLADTIAIDGANDIETAYSSASEAEAWVSGFNSNAGVVEYYDYGNADCPTSGMGPGVNGSCGNNWKQSDVWQVAYGVTTAFPLPEIYATSGANASQWQQIDLYSYYNGSGYTMDFIGAFTQYQACQQKGGCTGTNNTANAGWTQLYNALNCNGTTPCITATSTLPYSTDVRWV